MKKTSLGHSRNRHLGIGPSPEYRAYTAMKNRCLNPNQARFKDYGERGISICSRWLHGENGQSGFACFLEDMGTKPSPAHTLDRHPDNDGHYEPGNCRWATPSEQARNTRISRTVAAAGLVMNIADAADYFGIVDVKVIRRRLKLGWNEEDAVLTERNCKPTPPLEVMF